MKKLVQFIFLFIFLSLSSLMAQNPFDGKKKSVNTDDFVPSENLNVRLDATQRTVPDINFHYESTPFFLPEKGQREIYSNECFNKKGQLIFIEGMPENALSFDVNNRASVASAVYDYLSGIKNLIRIERPEQEFEIMEYHTDKYGGTHVKLQQYYQGLKVYRGQIFVHGNEQYLNKFNGEYFPTPDIQALVPTIDVESAYTIAKNDLEVPFIQPSEFELSLVNFQELKSELVLYHPVFESNDVHLSWHLTIRPNFLRRYEYFIDAHSGEILNSYNHTCSDGPVTAQATDLNGVSRTINTYQLGSSYYLIDASRSMFNVGQSQLPDNPVGAIWTIDAGNSPGDNLYHFTSSTNQWNSVPEAVSAHFNAGETYEYFKNTHARNSINGEGGTIISICNVTNEDGSSMENAFWNGMAMFYGNGGNIFSPLAGALDVGAHEMAHGVVQNTCNLEYQGESGALNESMADIAGCMVDREDWHLGEDVIINTTYYPTGYLRDMSNPHNGGSSLNDPCYQPSHVDEQYFGSQDNGGVHINSGIMNFVYYNFATAIGKNKAEEIYYKSMTDYLVRSSQFADARVAFVQSSTDIFGENSSETNAVKDAFALVGIGEGGGSSTPGQYDIEVNPGEDYILSYDVNSGDVNTLYISNTEASEFSALSTTELRQKPSIVDNGSWGVFVTPDNQIKGISLTDPVEEWLIDPEYSDYDNITISKDGRRIAIVTTAIDSAIWVYDFDISEWAKFHLFNPTFTPGVITENVLYADALEFDYSGQYIIYDAYNEFENASGEDIDYWDMSVLHVWDNQSNYWSDGNIEKIFTGLPEGVSVGNPTLSKNSPHILAFDYFDEFSGEVYVMAANMQTGDIGVIYQNTVLGYPNYSKHDNALIFNAVSTSDNDVVAQIGLASNKIEASGDPFILIDVAKWGTWFSTGERDFMDVKESFVQTTLQIYPNPVGDFFTISFDQRLTESSLISIYNMMGLKVFEQEISKDKRSVQLNVEDLPEGNYVMQYQNSKHLLSEHFIKL